MTVSPPAAYALAAPLAMVPDGRGIAISEAIRQFVIGVEGVPASKIHTIHYGLDPATVMTSVSIQPPPR